MDSSPHASESISEYIKEIDAKKNEQLQNSSDWILSSILKKEDWPWEMKTKELKEGLERITLSFKKE